VSSQDLSPRVSRMWSLILRRLALRLLTRPADWRLVVKRRREDRLFALAAVRIWLRYRTGCIRLGSFVWQ